MFLKEGKKNKIYKVKNFVLEDKLKKRLQVLGLTKGTRIEVLNKSFNGAMIFKVRGTRLAVSKKIVDCILVEEEKR